MSEIYVVAEKGPTGSWRVSTFRAFTKKEDLVRFLINNSDKKYKVAVVYGDRRPRILKNKTIDKMRSMEGLFDGKAL